MDRLTFLIQEEPKGYGQTLRPKTLLEASHFCIWVGDHLYLSRNQHRYAQQIIEIASRENGPVSGSPPDQEKMLPYFGCDRWPSSATNRSSVQLKRVIEKPTPTLAEQELTIAPVFVAASTSCFFGMHVLTPTVLDILESLVEEHQRPIALSEALQELQALRERYLAVEIEGIATTSA